VGGFEVTQTVNGKLVAEALGASIDGLAGRAGPSPKRLSDLLALSLAFPGEKQASHKLYSLLGGKWTFCFQFRKCLSCLFNFLWTGTTTNFLSSSVGMKAAVEVVIACCAAPLLHMCFRRPTS